MSAKSSGEPLFSHAPLKTMLEEEKKLKKVWTFVKSAFQMKKCKKSDLKHLLLAFQDINEFSRYTPKNIFEEFQSCLQNADRPKLLENDIKVIYNIGELCMEYNQIQEALKYFEEAVEIAVKNPNGDLEVLKLDSYVKVMAKLNRFNELTLIMTKLTIINSEYAYYRGLAFVEAKNYDVALKILMKCEQTTKIGLLLCRIQFELKNWKDLRSSATKITDIEHDENNVWIDHNLKIFLKAQYYQAIACFKLGNYRACNQIFQVFLLYIIDQFNKSMETIYELKDIIFELIPKAIEYLDVVMQKITIKERIDEEFTRLSHYAQMAFDLLLTDENVKAAMISTVVKLGLVLATTKESKICVPLHLIFSNFQSFAVMNRQDETLQELQSFDQSVHPLLKSHTYYMVILEKSLQYYANLKYYPEAIETYEKLIAINDEETNKMAHLYACTLGRVLFEDNQHEKCFQHFEKWIATKGNFGEAGEEYLWRTAFSYIYLRKYEKALKYFKKLIEVKLLNAGLFVIYLGMAYCFAKTQKYSKALKLHEFAKDLARGKDIPRVPFNKIILFHDKGDSRDTFKHVKTVAKSLKSVEHLVVFLQEIIGDEGQYLRYDWRNVLDTFLKHSKNIFQHPDTETQAFRTYRASSLLTLCIVNKKYDF